MVVDLGDEVVQLLIGEFLVRLDRVASARLAEPRRMLPLHGSELAEHGGILGPELRHQAVDAGREHLAEDGQAHEPADRQPILEVHGSGMRSWDAHG